MLKNMFLRRWISRSRALGIFRSPFHYESAGSCRSLNSACGRESATISNKPSGSPMRPPVLGTSTAAAAAAAEIVGYSHGWVAVFNKRSHDLYLLDPLSHRKINLPSIHTLPHPDFNLDLDGYGSVTKVILSSSPDDDDCRAMMTSGPANRLAFCLPGRSSAWTPLGEAFFDNDLHFPFESIARVHEDMVYCTRRRLFTSITASSYVSNKVREAERCDWDLQDPSSPQIVGSELLFGVSYPNTGGSFYEVLEDECVQIPHLVYAEESDQMFVVVQFVRLMSADGCSPLGFVPSCEVKGLKGVFPGRTFGFIVMEMDEEDLRRGKRRELNQRLCSAVEDLDGMSMVVGVNHSFAVSASDGEFKPNSIYFSDSKRLRMVSCAGDTGVFDYATKTISPLDHHPPPFCFT